MWDSKTQYPKLMVGKRILGFKKKNLEGVNEWCEGRAGSKRHENQTYAAPGFEISKHISVMWRTGRGGEEGVAIKDATT